MKEYRCNLIVPFEDTAVNIVKELTKLGIACYYQRTTVPPRKLSILMKLDNPSIEDALQIGALIGAIDKP
jgi:hypothetical protein